MSKYSEWDQVKETWPQMKEDMEIIEKLSKIGNINPISAKELKSIFHKIEWTIIEEFPNYSICKEGLIKNNTTSHIKIPSLGKRGYPVVSLWKDGKQYLRTIHILLGRTFIENDDPINKTQINHIDGNKENYNLENLEWVTPQENMMHARETGLHTSDGDKAVIQLSKDGKFIAEYKSASEASRQTGINRGNICKVSNHYVSKTGKHSLTAGGYKWEWKNNMTW